MNGKHGITVTPVSIILLQVFFLIIFFACSPRAYQIQRAQNLYREGQTLSSNGEYDRAMKKFEKSIDLAKRAGFKQGIAHNLNEMAIIYTIRGKFHRARSNFLEAMAIYKELHMLPEVSKALNNIALTYIREGNFPEAINYYEELIRWDRETGNELGVGITLNNLGHVYERYLHMPLSAKEKYIEALKIFERLNNGKYSTLMKRKILRINTFLDKQ